MFCFFFFFKQKTAYEMRISDWSSDVCSSDLVGYPSGDAETRIMRLVRAQELAARSANPAPLPSRISQASIFAARRAVLELHLAEPVERYIVELVLASRDASAYDAQLAKRIDRKSTRLNSSH